MLPDASVRRVLIYRLGSLGDTVVALPCLHLIARAFPDAERRLLTNFPVNAKAPSAAAVLEGSGLVHGYTAYTAGTRRPLELLKLAREIRRFGPDALVYLMNARSWRSVQRDRVFLRMAGVRRVIGVSDERTMEIRFDLRAGLYESEAMRLARMMSELGDAHLGDRQSWSLGLTESEKQHAAQALGALAARRLIVCAPGTKMPAKAWGSENWRELLRRIGARHPAYGLALVGADEEATVAEDAAGRWPGAKANLCGLSPRAMAAVMEHAEVFLGPDSGPMHVAAAAGVTCVIPFAATQLPGIWFPHGDKHQVVYHRTACAGCRLERCGVEGQRCMTSISVDEMQAAVERALGGKPGMKAITAIA